MKFLLRRACVICILCICANIILHPVALAALSGTTGEVSWKVQDHTLTFYGTGSMYNSYQNGAYVPWYGSRSSIKNVVIEEGVTNIGKNAFSKCSLLQKIEIPKSVTRINKFAFYSLTKFNDIFYCGDEESWNKIAIDSYNAPCKNATVHYIQKNLPYLNVSTEKNNGYISVDVVTHGIPFPYNIVIAEYKNNQMQSVYSRSTNSYKETFTDINDDASVLKVMIWNQLDIASPLCEYELVSVE